MTATILTSLISVIGLIFSLTKTGLFQKIITIGLAISVLIIWIGNKNFLFVGLLLQVCFAVISTIYSATVKELKIIERITIATMGMVLMLGTLSIILHYPGQEVLRFALLILLILFLWTSIKQGRNQPKEFGFMMIWAVMAVVQLSLF